MKKKHFVLILFSLCIFPAKSQSLQTAFEFMRLPSSAHASSLGGNTVSVPDAHSALFLSNPALITGYSSPVAGLNAMTWFASTKVAGAQWCSPLDGRSGYAVNARYVSYGEMARTAADGTATGSFKAKDMAVGISYAYRLTDNLSGGVTGNFICSRYSSLTSIAVGVDIGLLYIIPDDGVSLGLSVTNLGGQIKAFENTFQKLPLNLSAGITWNPAHAPLRFTLTLDRLTDWDREDFHFADDADSRFGEILRRHISFGTDILLTDRFYIAAGCNICRREEMSEKGSRGLTGISMGAGLNMERFSFDLSYGKYQVSESSLLLNIAFRL
ncbi:MAG: type IX secretion system protein PorQ [Bacteroidaceae bacterium]|nr:type IX secretion system protein PorQ [Bacteroidaceae bacterium]